MTIRIVTSVMRVGVSASGICYTHEALEQAVASFKASDVPVLGTFNQNTNIGYVDLTRAATKIIELSLHGDDLIVEQEVLDTQAGNELVAALEEESELVKVSPDTDSRIHMTPMMDGTLEEGVTKTLRFRGLAIRYGG